MGLIQLPRICFKGYAYWDPSTFNNNDYQPTYDAANARLNWTWLERHGAENAASVERYATQPRIIPTANEIEIATENPNVPPSEWNYYGGNGCGFVASGEPVIEWPAMFSKPAEDTAVTGFMNASGAFVDGSDPWIGLGPRLNAGMEAAKLVDVDPVCVWSSQIFVDKFSLGSESAGAGFAGETAGRAHARWFNLGRNLNADKKVIMAGTFAATFQIGLPAQTIKFFDARPAPDSGAAQLRAALDAPQIQGLLVRFTTYTTIYFQGAAFENIEPPDTQFTKIAALYREYAVALERYRAGAGAEPPPKPVNRAYSRTVGWIGPWAAGELRTMPGGRLLSMSTSAQPFDKQLPPVAPGPAVIECASDPATGTVTRLAIDLGATVPELDSTAKKVDFGTMYVGLAPVERPGAPAPIASIPYAGGYDQASYERTAGVVDIPASRFLAPVTANELRNAKFALWFGSSEPSLVETPFVAQTDARGVYVEQPKTPSDSTDWRSISIQVRYLGGKPPEGTRLCIAQYSPNRPFRPSGWDITSTNPASTAQSPYVDLKGEVMTSGDGYIVSPVPFVDDGNPFATVQASVRGIRPGFPIIAFYPIGPSAEVSPPPPSVAITAVSAAFYCVVRVLPFHNAMAEDFNEWLKTQPTADLVTQRVFDEAFRTYFLMYPVMRFLRDPLQFQAWRGPILELTDPQLFESARYMPVTRAFSVGQRRMLLLWDRYLSGKIWSPNEPVVRGPRRA